jgi:hypothetical protein
MISSKHPIEKIHIYKGKLCCTYLLKEIRKKESNLATKTDLNKLLKDKKTLFVNSESRTYLPTLPIKSHRMIFTTKVPTDRKCQTDRENIKVTKSHNIVLNYMNKKDFYY